MKCKQVEKAIIDSFGEKGVAALSDEIKNHIDQCKDCAGFLKNYQQLQTDFDSLSQPTLSERVAQTTLASCHGELVLAENLVTAQKPKTPLFIWVLFAFSIVMTILWAFPVLKDYANDQVVTNNLIWLLVLISQNLMMLLFSPVLLRRFRMDVPEIKMI